MTTADRRTEAADLGAATAGSSVADTDARSRSSEVGDDFPHARRLEASSSVGVVQQAVDARLDSRSDTSDTLFVAWSERGETTYRMGRRELAADAGILWSGRRPVQAMAQHAVIGSLLIDRDEFETRARFLLGQPEFVLPDLVPLPSPAHVALMRRELESLQARLDSNLVPLNALLARTAFDHTVAVVLAATGLDRPGTRAATSSAVRRAEVYIDENLHRAIGVADIAAAAGLSPRGLQSAFRRELGESPLQRVRRARLEQVRRELFAADPASSTVSEIAQRWGFTHLGRFANEYRTAYNTQPSHDLHR